MSLTGREHSPGLPGTRTDHRVVVRGGIKGEGITKTISDTTNLGVSATASFRSDRLPPRQARRCLRTPRRKGPIHLEDSTLQVWDGDELLKTALRANRKEVRKKNASRAHERAM